MLDFKNIDIKENQIRKINDELLPILLFDKTTRKNLIWATDNYEKHGEHYSSEQHITLELITGHCGNIIKPRTEKSQQEQLHRIRQKAEVFTPSWVCNAQNNLVCIRQTTSAQRFIPLCRKSFFTVYATPFIKLNAIITRA